MAVINVFQQYFEAACICNGVARRAAAVLLVCDSEAGNIRYEVAVNFFPHTSDDDFAVSYDAYFSRVVYEGAGRRSRKREETLLATLRVEAFRLADKAGGVIFWEKPLIEARRG